MVLVDKSKHPRFAVGESSTPTADFLVAYLAQRWNLKPLAPLACWGQWKKHYPDLPCGKKRGFSYYHHVDGKAFDTSRFQTESLLVAASSKDQWSDTHWLRSGVDAFLAEQAKASGVDLLESTQIESAQFDSSTHRWEIHLSDIDSPASKPLAIQATWLIDATGHHGLHSESMDACQDSDWMRTRTGAVYGHFQGVSPFESAASPLDPFCGDDAAQHHVLDEGWFWMLRFDHGITSVGLVEPSNKPRSKDTFWKTIERHPSIAKLMQNAKLVAPVRPATNRSNPVLRSIESGTQEPILGEPSMATVDRMSRCRSHAWGKGWVSLPVSYGFIDPLHSSGIAHALSGVVRLAEALLLDRQQCYSELAIYGTDLRRELQWLDLLVAGCYAGQPSFDNFLAYACMYFISAIEFEKQLAFDPSHWPKGFMQSNDRPLVDVAIAAYEILERSKTGDGSKQAFPEQLRRWIEPWNRVGLLDPSNSNRIAHSVAPKYAMSIDTLCDALGTLG